jgi:spore germination protein KC
MIVKFQVPLNIVLLTLLTLLIGGCWDETEIKERAIAVGMGIDKIPGNDPILLTVQIINLRTLKNTGQNSGSSQEQGTAEKDHGTKGSVIAATSTGKSLYDAIHNFQKYSTRRVTFFHNRVVVLGRALAQSDITGVCDDMARDYQFRKTNWLLVAENTAREILELKTDLGTIPAKEVDQMMVNLDKEPFIRPVNLNDFIIGLESEGKASLVPLVNIKQPGPNPPSGIGIALERTAVFKNSRLIDILNPEESQGLLWLTGGRKAGSVVFSDPLGTGQKMISVEISEGTSRIRPRITKAGIIMEITCTGNGTLWEMEALENTPQTIKRLEHKIDHILEQRTQMTISKAQQIKADFLGFAGLIHGDYPDLWRRMKPDWDEEFSRLKCRVHFQIKLTSFGMIKDGILRTALQE